MTKEEYLNLQIGDIVVATKSFVNPTNYYYKRFGTNGNITIGTKFKVIHIKNDSINGIGFHQEINGQFEPNRAGVYDCVWLGLAYRNLALEPLKPITSTKEKKPKVSKINVLDIINQVTKEK